MLPKPTALAILLGGLAFASGCREKARDRAPPDGPQPDTTEASAAAPAREPPEPARCRELRAGSLFSVGEAVPAREPPPGGVDDGVEGEEEEPVAAPFAVELGGAVGVGDGFAVGVLQDKQRGQRVALGLIGGDGSGRVLEIGTVHGDVEPPLLAVLGERVVALFGDSDAGGARLRTATLGPGADQALFGPELTGVERDGGAALAAGEDELVVAFSRAVKGKPRLLTARFRPGAGGEFSAPETVAVQAAESPRLSARPGGFWLAWIEQHALPTAVRRRGNAGDDSDTGDEEPGGLELGPRSLRLVALDASGRAQGAPLALTKNDSHVLAFELSPWPDGGAIVAWRDDSAAPGVEGGALHLAHVRADGSSEAGELDDQELGAGVPSLIVDPAPRSPGALVWIAAGGGSEITRFGLLTGSGTTTTPLSSDKLLGTAELIGVHGGRLLAARPRRTARDLFLLECVLAP